MRGSIRLVRSIQMGLICHDKRGSINRGSREARKKGAVENGADEE